MGDPFSSAAFGSIGTTITVLRFVWDVKNTPVDVKTFLDLVNRVDEDLQYAISLRVKHLKLLSESPIELRRLDRIIETANESILDVARLLEPCRREAHGGKVPMIGRIKWVLGDSTAISKRTANIQQQHAAINVEIAYLRTLESLQPLEQMVENTTYENMKLFASRGRSPSRTSILSSDKVSPPPPPEYSQDALTWPMFQPVAAAFELASDTGQIASNDGIFYLTPPSISDVDRARSQPALETDVENEDAEVAYFRSLKRQEEKRRKRRAARG